MYGDGNSSRLVGDIINSTAKITDGLTEATGVDIKAILSGFLGGKMASAKNDSSVAGTSADEYANSYEEVSSGDYIINPTDYSGYTSSANTDYTTDTTE